jgi:hypothetical protein
MRIKCKDMQKGKLNPNVRNAEFFILWFHTYFLTNWEPYGITVMLMVILTDLPSLYINVLKPSGNFTYDHV